MKKKKSIFLALLIILIVLIVTCGNANTENSQFVLNEQLYLLENMQGEFYYEFYNDESTLISNEYSWYEFNRHYAQWQRIINFTNEITSEITSEIVPLDIYGNPIMNPPDRTIIEIIDSPAAQDLMIARLDMWRVNDGARDSTYQYEVEITIWDYLGVRTPQTPQDNFIQLIRTGGSYNLTWGLLKASMFAI